MVEVGLRAVRAVGVDPHPHQRQPCIDLVGPRLPPRGRSYLERLLRRLARPLQLAAPEQRLREARPVQRLKLAAGVELLDDGEILLEGAGSLCVVASSEVGSAEDPARNGAQVGGAVGLGDLEERGGDGHRRVSVTAAVQDLDADAADQDVGAGVLEETCGPAGALLQA